MKYVDLDLIHLILLGIHLNIKFGLVKSLDAYLRLKTRVLLCGWEFLALYLTRHTKSESDEDLKPVFVIK